MRDVIPHKTSGRWRRPAAGLVLAVLVAGLPLLAACVKSSRNDQASEASSAPVVYASDLHPCDVTDTQLTIEDCEAARNVVAQAKKGAASFTTPKWMLDGISSDVTLAVGTNPNDPNATVAISPAPPASAATAAETNATATDAQTAGADSSVTSAASAAAAAPADAAVSPHATVAAVADQRRDTIVDYHVFVGSKMAADLNGDGFTITPVKPRIQPVSDGATTVWQWRVTPHGTGKRTLIMSTAVIMVDSQGAENQLKPTSTLRPIKIYVGPATLWDFIKNAPAVFKALGAFLVAAGGLAAAWRTFQKKISPEAPGGQDGPPEGH